MSTSTPKIPLSNANRKIHPLEICPSSSFDEPGLYERQQMTLSVDDVMRRLSQREEDIADIVDPRNKSSPNDHSMNNKSLQMPSLRLLLTGIAVVLGAGFHFGFQISIINPLAETLQTFLVQSLERRYAVQFTDIASTVLWSSVAGTLFIGAVIGAAIAPSTMAKIGSRWSFVLTSSVMLVALAIGALSKPIESAELFIVSRFTVGICVGMATTLQGVFLTEISPVYCRGFMGTLAGLSINIGFLLASAFGLPQLFGTPSGWPLCFFAEMIPSAVLLVVSLFALFESPLEYLRRGDDLKARKAIDAYYRRAQQHPDLLKELRIELSLNSNVNQWKSIFTDRATRCALYLSVLLNVTVSFSGIMAISFFGTLMLSAIGFSTRGAALANCLSTLSGTAGCIVGSLSIDKIGRRFLILVSLSSLLAINVGMMGLVWTFVHYRMQWLGYAFLVLFNIFLFVFSVGVGPMAWFISTELTDSQNRPRVQSLSTSSQYITCFICPILYSPLQKLVGPFSFMLFIIPLTFSTLYIYCFMPETQQRTISQIRALLSEGIRDFNHETQEKSLANDCAR
ncbi:unnamed protein product [Anisakis simplex]|uniref:MFS domain-containing protein n=1 Tax=Anisakis simplex TaxID=6269 RepID=A0A0M3K3Q8_ANISI|nr:unnamed protein product [Anisakis simplex]